MKNINIEIKATPEAQKVIDLLNASVQSSPTGVSFVSIKGYENRFGEVSNNLINVGASYDNAKQKDIEALQNFDILSVETTSDKVTLEKARTELINSLQKPDSVRSNGQKNAYTHITKGLKVHNETGAVMVYGFRQNKTVVTEGNYPTVNSRALTIAKNELKKLANLRTAKFTQYKMDNVEQLTLNGETLEF